MNFSMRGHDFDAQSVKEVSAKCGQYGVYGVQLVMPKTIPDFKVGSFSPAYAQRIKAELDENNVKEVRVMVLFGADRAAEFASILTGRVALLTSPSGRTAFTESSTVVLIVGLRASWKARELR